MQYRFTQWALIGMVCVCFATTAMAQMTQEEIDRGADLMVWQMVDCQDPKSVEVYLDLFPDGQYVAAAQRCLAQYAPPPPPPPPAPPLPPARSVKADDRGCWSAGSQCIRTEGHWDDYDAFHVTWTNLCGARVFIQYCIEECRIGLRGGGTLHGRCATTALAHGEAQQLMREAHHRPTGRTWVQWTGSLDTFQDDHCRDISTTWQEAAGFETPAGHNPPPCDPD